MKKVYKTKNNVQKIWERLDKAYELLEKSFEDLNAMSNISETLSDDINRFDLSAITGIKNQVEELIEKVEDN